MFTDSATIQGDLTSDDINWLDVSEVQEDTVYYTDTSKVVYFILCVVIINILQVNSTVFNYEIVYNFNGMLKLVLKM